MGALVVGVDGSASGLFAVEAAAREARWRGAGLRLVHAFIWPAMHVSLGRSFLGPPESGLRNMVERLMAEAHERARTAAPEVGTPGPPGTRRCRRRRTRRCRRTR